MECKKQYNKNSIIKNSIIALKATKYIRINLRKNLRLYTLKHYQEKFMSI